MIDKFTMDNSHINSPFLIIEKENNIISKIISV